MTSENGVSKTPGLQVPTPDQIAQEDLLNNCFVRTVLSGVMGGGLGLVFGLFASSMEGASGSMAPVVETRRARDVFFDAVRSTRIKSVSYAKGFAAMGAMFAGSECVVEKYRAKHDIYNSAYAGCFTGGALAHSGGPKMMCIGCASFAAFSVLIERFLDH